MTMVPTLLTSRDFMAIEVMKTLILKYGPYTDDDTADNAFGSEDAMNVDRTAEYAYAQADAMMAAR